MNKFDFDESTPECAIEIYVRQLDRDSDFLEKKYVKGINITEQRSVTRKNVPSAKENSKIRRSTLLSQMLQPKKYMQITRLAYVTFLREILIILFVCWSLHA